MSLLLLKREGIKTNRDFNRYDLPRAACYKDHANLHAPRNLKLVVEPIKGDRNFLF